MNEKEFIDWLDRENILNLAKKYSSHFEKILKQCLNVGKEKVLLVGDLGYPTRRVAPLLIGCYFLAAKKMNLNVDFVLQEPKRSMEKADPILVKKLFDLPMNSTVIVNVSGKIGLMSYVGKSFRKFCKVHKNKFVSTTSLSKMDTFMIKSIIDALSVNYDELQKQDRLLKTKIIGKKVMTIKTRAGTDLTMDIRRTDVRIADGNYTEFGTGGNLPAGEIYFAPINTNGKVVIDGSSRNEEDGILIQKPITLIIENNRVVAIKGDEEARLLDKSLTKAEARARYPERIREIAEIGIGTNVKAKIIGSTIIDEKAYGTAHIAIGSNYWFGGKNRTIIHYDQVFKNPRIRVDGQPLRF
jgi:hypothetical protein